jgi:antitoxin VapB
MAFHVRDKKTDALVRELARKRGLGLTEAIKLAVTNELDRQNDRESLWDRTRRLRQEVATSGKNGPKADKAFFDELSGQED